MSEDELKRIIREIESGGHSLFSPSAAHRWLSCTASVKAILGQKAARADLIVDEDGTPISSSNYWSVEGTAAHHVAEVWLRRGEPPSHLRGQTYSRDGIDVVMDDEMFTEVERYVEWCRDLGPGFSAVETRVSLEGLFPIPNQGGTCDHMHFDRSTGRLTITDLKYGKGVRVLAENNPQGLLYGIGAIGHIEALYGESDLIREVEVRIAQPRLDSFPTWVVTMGDVLAFAAEVRRKSHEAWGPNPRYSPEPKACRFCPVKATCGALAHEVESLVNEAFGNNEGEQADIEAQDVPVPGALSLERMAEVLKWRPTIDSWMAAIETELFRRADAGDEVPGFKIVEGRHRREWKNERDAAEWLSFLGLPEDRIWKRRLVSPRQAELALRALRIASKRAVAAEVTSTPGPRTLAPTIDPRSALAGSADVFDQSAEDDDDLS